MKNRSKKPLNIVVIAATTRESRQSIHVARLVEEVGLEFNEIKTIFVDVKAFFPLPGEGSDEASQNPEWIAINEKSDGYFIVSPEYNHSFPGSLKMLLDNDFKNYYHKPVAIAGVSAGPFGGARMIENLIGPLRKMGMVLTTSDVHVSAVHDLFAESTDNSSQIEQLKERIRRTYTELIWMAEALREAREE